jgi:hypothetical protein
MRNWLLSFALLLATLPSPAQTQPQPPQTARQALIEMFLSNDTDAFAKHLPDATRRLLPQNQGEPYASIMSLLSAFGNRRLLRGQRAETFDDGPTILVSQQSETDKIEVSVEHDLLAGESEEIELSAHFYHDGREQPLSVIPRLTFTLKEEKKIWRLIDVTAMARVPLTDPDYLRGLRQQQQEANESMVEMRIGTITAAEVGYATQHPDRGYICSLPALFSQEPKEIAADDGSDQPRVYYDPGQESSEWMGYRFAVTGCDGSPGSKYQITAVPIDSDAGTKMFCADESGMVKASTGGKISECFSGGDVVSSPTSVTELTE